jgi:hypothetical protein
MNLTKLQIKAIKRAIVNNSGVNLRLKTSQLEGHDRLNLTIPQEKKLNRAKEQKKGVLIKMSKTQLKRLVKNGYLSGGSMLAQKGTTSDADLIKMAQKFKIPNFKVFGVHQLPEQMGDTEYSICNLMGLDPSTSGGTHWVALCSQADRGQSYYFDSFGVEHIDPRIERYLNSVNRPITLNKKWIQEIDSTNCGSYCIYVLDQLSEGVPFNEIMSQFGHDRDQNEIILETTPID